MGFKGWREVAWRDVDAGTRVRTADDREWIVRAAWNGSRVLLAPNTTVNVQARMGRPVYGPVVPVPLVDGDKLVRALLDLAGKPAGDSYVEQEVGPHEFKPGNGGRCWFGDCNADESAAVHTPPPFAVDANGTDPADPMTPGMPDPCQPIGCDNGIHRPGCVFAAADEPTPTLSLGNPEQHAANLAAMSAVDRDAGPSLREVAVREAIVQSGPLAGATVRPKFGAADPVTGTRSARLDVPIVLSTELPGRKFGQPTADGTAAEKFRGDASDDEGKAVAALATDFPDAELVAVEDEVNGILVPRALDDMALRSHLFLMHGWFYAERDVERGDLERDHRASHETGDTGHTHVDWKEPA